MSEERKFRLYFLQEEAFFPEGTLFELVDDGNFVIPDRGDGEPSSVAATQVLACPDFAENVPPGQCPVKVTSFSSGKTAEVTVDQTLHWQIIAIPVPEAIQSIVSATVTDRLRGTEADRYEASTIEPNETPAAYRLHIGHLRPGFYEALIELPDDDPLRLTFIKFFPKHFTARYAELTAAQQPRIAGIEIRQFEIPASRPSEHNRGDPFSEDLLNTALRLTTEWGENYSKPIDERILKSYPELSPDEIAELTKRSREAEYFIYELAEQELSGSIAENDIVPMACGRFSWLDESNASRLKNIGMFYARK